MTAWVAAFAFILSIAAIEKGPQRADAKTPGVAHQFLADHLQLGAGDFRELDRGQPVTRSLQAVDGREVATLGVVRIGVPAAFYIDQLRDIVAFKREGAGVRQIGAFSNPAIVDDVAGLSLDDGDLESLSQCRPRDCKVQLSADAVERVRRDVPWGNPEAKAVAERTMRAMLVDVVNQYRNAGDAGLVTYVDADRPLSLASEFRSMVASPPAVLERFPNLHRHVMEFPRDTPASIDDIVYWSKEKMGPVVIMSVTHLAITRLRDGLGGAFAAASKQIYGSHYFDSSLGITIVLDDGERGALLAYVNRSRLDALRGFWGGLKRTIVRSRTRSAMGSSLVEARNLVERRFRTLSAKAA